MLEIKPGHTTTLPRVGTWPETRHVFDEASIWAVNAALAAQRPLLVRGEPGSGKSQLARAAAKELGRAFVPAVVHSRSESQDLLFCYDAVCRLGEAQALAASRGQVDVRAALAPVRFVSPGPLWWTFDWPSAAAQAKQCLSAARPPERPKGWQPKTGGAVLLIDEIDKAEADLPNGLLETLGNGAFTVPLLGRSVGMRPKAPT
ncbi:MAG: AAA family ATPase [Thermodesulfobacteriota bacterium]